MDCVFCKIVAGELPAHKVYEDDDLLAFLDIQPITRGHALLIPKAHHANLSDTPAPVLAKISAALPSVCRAVVRGTDSEGFNVLQSNGACAGQVVSHVHFHIVPRKTGDGIGLGFRHHPPVKDDLAHTAQEIRAALK